MGYKEFFRRFGIERKSWREKSEKEHKEYVKNDSIQDARYFAEEIMGEFPSRNYYRESSDSVRRFIEEERENAKDLRKKFDTPKKIELYRLAHQKGYERGDTWAEFGWEKILTKEEYKKYQRREKIKGVSDLVTLSAILYFFATLSIFFFSPKNYKYYHGVGEAKEFYQEHGVCPVDSTSADFYEWQKLWNEKFNNSP